MFNGDCSDPISVLPPEVLKHILNYLPFSYLETIRPTCKAFDAAAVDLLCEGLHGVRLRVDKAAITFMNATWLRTDHAGVAAVLTYAKRLAKGAGSLVILAALIRATDLCSRQFVLVRALPPLPGSVLEDIVIAVKMATWRNPLIGVTRLQHIYRDLLTYFTHNRVRAAKVLPPAVMFRTVLDVLQNMPRLTSSTRLEQTAKGVCLSCTLPPVRVHLQPRGRVTTTDTDELLLKLVQLSMRVVDRYILTPQAQKVLGDDLINEHDGYITDIQLTVPCEHMQELSLQRLRQLEPSAFFVTLSGFKITTPTDLEDLEAREDIRIDYSFCQFFCLG